MLILRSSVSLLFSAVGSQFRQDGPIQSFSLGEAGSNPLIHGYAPTTNQSYFSPHLAPSSLSRLGQQPVQRHNVGRSAQFHEGEWSMPNVVKVLFCSVLFRFGQGILSPSQ